MGQKGEDLMAFIDKPETSVELPVSRNAEGSALAKLCVDILTFLLFQRRQIPETVQILQRNNKTKNVNCPSNPRQRQSNEPVRVQKQVSQLLDAVAAVNRSLSDLLRAKDVKEIHVLFGATPSSAKEIFTVNLKEFCLCKKPTQVPEKWISECSRKICKKLFMRNEFLDDTCALTNTYILAKATKTTKVAGWLPWPQYKYSEKKLRLEITILPTSNGCNSNKEGDDDDKENQLTTQNGMPCSASKAESYAARKEGFLKGRENKTRSLKEDHRKVSSTRNKTALDEGPPFPPIKLKPLSAECASIDTCASEIGSVPVNSMSPDTGGICVKVPTNSMSTDPCVPEYTSSGIGVSNDEKAACSADAAPGGEAERLELLGNAKHSITISFLKTDRGGDASAYSDDVSDEETPPLPVRARRYSAGERLIVTHHDSGHSENDLHHGSKSTPVASRIEDLPVSEYRSNTDDMRDDNAEAISGAGVSKFGSNTDDIPDGNVKTTDADAAPVGSIESSGDITYNNANSHAKAGNRDDASPHCHDEEPLDDASSPRPVRVRRYSAGKSFVANSSLVTVEEPASDCKDVTEKSWSAIQPSTSADVPGLNSIDPAMPPMNDFEDVLTPEMTEQSESTSNTIFPTSRRSRPYRSLDGVEDVYVDTDLPSPPSISVRRFSAGDAVNTVRQLLLETFNTSPNELKKCDTSTSETLPRGANEILTLEDCEKISFENCGIDSGKTGDISINSSNEALPGDGIFAHEQSQNLVQGGMPEKTMVESSIKPSLSLPQGSPIRVHRNSLDEDSDSDPDPPPSVHMRRFSAGTVCDSLGHVLPAVNEIGNQAKPNAHSFTSLHAPSTLNALDSLGQVLPEVNGIDNLATPNANSFISLDASSAIDALCDSKAAEQNDKHQDIPNHLQEENAANALNALCGSKAAELSDRTRGMPNHLQEKSAANALNALCDSKVVGQGARHQGIPNHLHEKDASSALDALCDSKVGGQSDQHLDVLAHQEEEERGKSHSLGLGDGGAGEPLLGASTKPDVSFNSMPLTACFGTDNEFKLKADSGTKLPSAPRETVLQQTGIAPETENMEQNKGFEEYMWFKSNIVIKGFRY